MKKRGMASGKIVDKSEPKKDFLWRGLRISFFGMLGGIVLFFIDWFIDLNALGYSEPNNYHYDKYGISYIFQFVLILLFAVIFLFAVSSTIFSIKNLIKKRSKIFSLAVLISSIVVIIFAIYIIVWFIGSRAGV